MRVRAGCEALHEADIDIAGSVGILHLQNLDGTGLQMPEFSKQRID